MNKVILSLGANLGNPSKQLEDALIKIEERVGKITNKSSVYETEAWGVSDQPPFLNQVVIVETSLWVTDVLRETQAIEEELGRVRKEKWGPRVIDIDILYYNDDVIANSKLMVPHVFMTERRFVLVPLVEVAPDFVHPVKSLTSKQLLARCKDKLNVNFYTA